MKKRNNIIPVERVLSDMKYFIDNKIDVKLREKEYNGKLVSLRSETLKIFTLYGIKCYMCGLEGKFFKIFSEKGKSGFFINLYGIDNKNNWILMTKDHVTPKIKGGTNSLSNLKPMCLRCNMFKGGMKI